VRFDSDFLSKPAQMLKNQREGDKKIFAITCKVVMDRLGIETAFTFDEDDFETLGITVIP